MLQKVLKRGRNGNVGEFRHMTTSFFSTCLIMIKSDSVQDSFWSNHKDVSNSITYEHLSQLPLNNEPRPYRSTSRDFHNWKKMKYIVMCLNSPTLPFLPCFITFCSTHSYTSYFYEIFATCYYSCYANRSIELYSLWETIQHYLMYTLSKRQEKSNQTIIIIVTEQSLSTPA